MKKSIYICLAALGLSASASAFTGESLANQILQNDTINGASGLKMIFATVKGERCQPQLLKSKVLQPPTDIRQSRGQIVAGWWREEWTLQCNQNQWTVPIKFVLDPTGASYIIGVSEIR